MVSFVFVSHSEKLAEGIIDLAKISAPNVTMLPAGGMMDGSAGTSLEKIMDAINRAHNDDGVVLLTDLGSADMTADMAIEQCGFDNVIHPSCPMVEGAVMGTVLAEAGSSIEEIKEQIEEI